MSMGRAALCVLLLCSACTKSEPTAESAACCTNDAPSHSHDKAPSAATAAAATGATGSARLSPDDVIVRGSVTQQGIALSVQNHAETSVSLKSAVRVERVAGDRWESVTATGLALRDSCASEAPACVTLAPGAELLPPAWPAVIARGQCGACPACPAIADGEYKFVVEACENNSIATSTAFSIRADGH